MWVGFLVLGLFWQAEAQSNSSNFSLPPTLSPAREAALETQYLAGGLITFAICICCLCIFACCKQRRKIWETPPIKAEDVPLPQASPENLRIVYDRQFGVGFSGGGVRSAAFCSGVLWGLIHLNDGKSREDDFFLGGPTVSLPQGRVPQFISSVSGGGYVASSFTYWARFMRGVDPREWSEQYFENMRNGIGFYCDCTTIFSALYDTIAITSMFGVLSALSVLAWFPTTYVLGEFILMPYSAYYNAFTNTTATPVGEIADKVGANEWNNDILWLLWLFVVTGMPFFIIFGNFSRNQATEELKQTYLGEGRAKKRLRWWKLIAEVTSHLNYSLASVFVVFGMVVLFDFSYDLSGSDLLSSDLTTTAVIWSLQVIILYLVFTKSFGLFPLFVQAQILIWIYWSPHNALLLPDDKDFDANYRKFAIFSKIAIPFLAVLGLIRERMIFEFSRWRLSRCFYNVPGRNFTMSYAQHNNRMSRLFWKQPKFGQYPTFLCCTTANGWMVVPSQDTIFEPSELLKEQEFNFYYEMLPDNAKSKVDSILSRAVTFTPIANTRSMRNTKAFKTLQTTLRNDNSRVLDEAIVLARNIVMSNPDRKDKVERFELTKVQRAEALALNLRELAWSQAKGAAAGYDILALSSEGWWERYEDGLTAPMKIFPEGILRGGMEGDIIVGANPNLLLSEVMCMSAAAGSFSNGEYGGLAKDEERTQVMFGLHMGRWVETNVKRGLSGVLFLILVDLLIGLPVIVLGGTDDPFKRTGMTESGTNNGDYTAYLGGALSLLLFTLWCTSLPIFAHYFPRVYPFLPRARDFKTLTGEVNWSHSIPSMLYVSDGGHTENLGLCPLLARRLQYIVLACGAEDETCEALRSALEQARKKLGCWFLPVRSDQKRRGVDRITSDPYLNLLSDIEFFARDDARVMVIQVIYRDQMRGWRNHAGKDLTPTHQSEMGYIFYVKPISIHPRGFLESSDTMMRDEPFGAPCVKPLPRSHESLGGCCCLFCHRFSFLNKISGVFPFHHTAFQFFTPLLFDAYHAQGVQAMKDAFGVKLQANKRFNTAFERKMSVGS